MSASGFPDPVEGVRWGFGMRAPAFVAVRLTGPAGISCRLFVKRIDRAGATALKARGPATETALEVARAHL